ncbi:transposase [Streptomyces sp. NPDC102279]|uniref:transposase n=1 Tax=Streptomyces sp. NPDC102279 TaxID=3366153 RepID=UPI003817761C
MLNGRRKSIQPTTERLPAGNMQTLQQFVNQSPRDPPAARERIDKRLTGLVDMSFPKCGRWSVGGPASTAERWDVAGQDFPTT